MFAACGRCNRLASLPVASDSLWTTNLRTFVFRLDQSTLIKKIAMHAVWTFCIVTLLGYLHLHDLEYIVLKHVCQIEAICTGRVVRSLADPLCRLNLYLCCDTHVSGYWWISVSKSMSRAFFLHSLGFKRHRP